MLISAVLTLAPTGPVTLPANLGRAAHAWFLNQVRAAAPTLAEALHAPNQERPFTVSNLLSARSSDFSRFSAPPTTKVITTSTFQREMLLSPERSYALQTANIYSAWLYPRSWERSILENSYPCLPLLPQ